MSKSPDPIERGSETSLGQEGYCRACDQLILDGPDACLGLLAGVSHACCGHGDIGLAYVVIGGIPNQDANTIRDRTEHRGKHALDYFHSLGVGP